VAGSRQNHAGYTYIRLGAEEEGERWSLQRKGGRQRGERRICYRSCDIRARSMVVMQTTMTSAALPLAGRYLAAIRNPLVPWRGQ